MCLVEGKNTKNERSIWGLMDGFGVGCWLVGRIFEGKRLGHGFQTFKFSQIQFPPNWRNF